MNYNFRNDAIRWQISKSTNVIFTFFIFAKVRPVRTIVTDIQTDNYTYMETDKAMAIGEIADLQKSDHIPKITDLLFQPFGQPPPTTKNSLAPVASQSDKW